MRGVAVCSIHLLAKTVGYCRAFELCDVIDARRAEALGLVGTAKKGRESRRRRRHWAGRPVSSHLRRGDCLVIWELDRLDRRKIALLSFVMFRTQNTEV